MYGQIRQYLIMKNMGSKLVLVFVYMYMYVGNMTFKHFYWNTVDL